MPGSSGPANLNRGTPTNPAIIAAMAPRAVMLRHVRDKMSVGQNVAAMPDQPKMTNQNTVWSGPVATTATPSATIASANVASRDRPSKRSSGRSGCQTCW